MELVDVTEYSMMADALLRLEMDWWFCFHLVQCASDVFKFVEYYNDG
jgi:hypothetical protein